VVRHEAQRPQGIDIRVLAGIQKSEVRFSRTRDLRIFLSPFDFRARFGALLRNEHPLAGYLLLGRQPAIGLSDLGQLLFREEVR